MINILKAINRVFLKTFPGFEDTLKKAAIKEDAAAYIAKSFILSLIFSFIITIPFLLGFLKKGITLLALFPILIFSFLFLFWVFALIPKMNVRKRKKEIESDLIYSVRHLLLKLQCNNSLLNSLGSVASLPTLSAKYFAEVTDDVDMGSPIEEAVDYALKYAPSDKFKTVMEEIKNSLKAGTNLRESLEITLKEMTEDKIIEIKDYGKKLGSLAMLYMIVGTIVPSLGSAAFVVGISFINLGEKFSSILLIVLAVFLLLSQVFFYMLFNSIKPMALQ